jgi:hypothetical protein
MKTPIPIGAEIQYRWPEDAAGAPVRHGYVSFGAFIETLGNDSFGVSDDDILYYAESEENLRNPSSGTDFLVQSYELVYRDQRDAKAEKENEAADRAAVRTMIKEMRGSVQRTQPTLPDDVSDMIELDVRGVRGLLCKLILAAVTDDGQEARRIAGTILTEAAANARENER